MRRLPFLSALLFILLTGSNTAFSQTIDSIKAPHYGETLLHFYQQNYYTALTHLLAARKQQRLKHHEHDSELLLGSLYLAYGIHDQARDIFERLVKDKIEPETANHAWFYLAKIYHQRGYRQKAWQALNKISGKLQDKELQQQKQLLEAAILMADGEYEKAIPALITMQPDSVAGAFGRYNLGIALLKSGQTQQGIAALNSISEMATGDEELNALRDRANLTLGFIHLKEYQGQQAQRHFEQIQLNGPYANQALLGLGWTHSTLSQYYQALAYWQELRQRNKLDDAVQESLLAMPYALDQLYAHKQALQQYQHAVEIYQTQLQRIQYFIETIPGSQLADELLGEPTPNETGWFWQLQHLTNITENYYLQELFSQHDFQEMLKNYRDLKFIQNRLQQKYDDLQLYNEMLNARRNKLKLYSQTIDKQLSGTKLNSIKDKYTEITAKLDRIKRDNDPMALATSQELKQLSSIEHIARRIRKLSNHQSTDKYQKRLSFLKGIVLWNIGSQYAKRLQQKQQAMESLARTIKEYSDKQIDIRQKQHSAIQSIAHHQKQITMLQTKTTALQQNIEKLLHKQSLHIEQMAIDVLQEKSERISDYLAQASIAIAQIYDRADEKSGDER